MFAVVAFGGKQYKLQANFVSDLEKVAGNPGDLVTFDDVVFVVNDDNTVYMDKKVSVSAVIVKHFREKKIRIFKKRQRTSGFEKHRGHRQAATRILVKEIVVK